MLGFATEEIALRTGETLGGLLNATFGNAVELIVAVIALIDNTVAIVKTSLIGSILSNLLLVMGCCFFGGLRRPEQFFKTTVAQTAASLLALAAASVIVPSVFDAALSRGTAVILLLVYAAYLFFQLKTHQTVFSEQRQKVPAKPWTRASLGSGAVLQGFAMPGSLMGHGMPHARENERLSRMLMSPLRFDKDCRIRDDGDGGDGDDDDEEPQLHFLVALATLAGSTAIIALCAEYMVDSIDSVTRDGPLSVELVGLILLPIVGNAAEHATAVTVAIKDKMDLAIGVAVGSSMQVALFLIPLLVVIGWGKGNDDMKLSFDFFQVAVMFVAVLLTNYLIGDGKSHWLEGFLLICLYAIIAVCSFCECCRPPPLPGKGGVASLAARPFRQRGTFAASLTLLPDYPDSAANEKKSGSGQSAESSWRTGRAYCRGGSRAAIFTVYSVHFVIFSPLLSLLRIQSCGHVDSARRPWLIGYNPRRHVLDAKLFFGFRGPSWTTHPPSCLRPPSPPFYCYCSLCTHGEVGVFLPSSLLIYSQAYTWLCGVVATRHLPRRGGPHS